MIIDLQLESPESRDITADVCIIGAGPAGISLALELARGRPDWHIVLSEAGGPDNATIRERDIYKVAQGKKKYGVLDISRRRKLGGTTTHWGGWSKPLDATDYEDNSVWDVPAWPISPQELSPYFHEALTWLGINNGSFEFGPVRKRHTKKLLALRSGSRITERLFRFSPPTRFGQRYLDDLVNQSNLTCLLHANLYELERRGERVRRAHVRPLGGEPLSIKATYFILAMGGMETTRQLLNMRGYDKSDGEGIHSPHLGRYFADHYGASPGHILAPANLQYSRFLDGDNPIMPVLTFSENDIRANKQHNACMMLHAKDENESLLAGYGGQQAVGFRPGQYGYYGIQMIVEPRPNPASTLTLTDERCELGLRRMKLDWKPHTDDFNSAYALYQALAAELNLSGLGRSCLSRPNTPKTLSRANGSCHHLGTTRMAADSRDGVVDRNLKVFGSDNLYVASSSVFPRYGYSNPTFTIVTLALRLAKLLANQK